MDRQKVILCFGDSNTWGASPSESGVRYPRDVRWPGQLQKILGDAYYVIEEGQPGRTTVWDDPIEQHKNGAKVLPSLLESHRPLDLVIILLGTNDLKARFSLTPEDIALGARRLVMMVTECPVLLVCPPPTDSHAHKWQPMTGAYEKSLGLGEKFAKVAAEVGCDFLDAGSLPRNPTPDGFHWDTDFHVELARAIKKIITLE
ncbi:MAG: SGNH/GDSL hydrolase family protein [Spirochaetales bacterium]|nr:SGNH/GDSL hydrolase family protein [Spirochaetales bacterium]